MSPNDPFETELRKLNPAKPPEELLARLESLRKDEDRKPIVPIGAVWGSWWRWLAPLATGVAVILLLLHWRHDQIPTAGTRIARTGHQVSQTNNVEFNQQLLAAFDAVARLPGGEPIRFRCREWQDLVTLRDPARGLVIEQRTPRLEIVPVSFDTY